jgi:lysophospholipase L1-like esterase
LLFGAIVTMQCGGNPSGPTNPPPPADPPAITCPASLTVPSPNGQPLAVSYAMPAVVGGTQPVTVVCTPATGSTFQIGSSTVTCVAADAAQRRQSCSFSVTVTSPPRASATRFVAFGDSITEGLNAIGPLLLIPNPPNSYPGQLQALLAARYTAQTMSVLDEGLGGERANDPVTQARLVAALNTDAPEALLLMEGVNDLQSGAAAIPGLISALRTMVREGRRRGLPVFVGTLLPERVGGSRAGAAALIVPTNDQIRPMVAEEGAVLVDVYQAFGGSPDPGIGDDGLHPNSIGNGKIAQAFFDAIRASLERPVGTSNLSWYR